MVSRTAVDRYAAVDHCVVQSTSVNGLRSLQTYRFLEAVEQSNTVYMKSLVNIASFVIFTLTYLCLRQGLKEVVFSSALVSLFVSRMTQKLRNRFSQNSSERWHMNHGRNR